MLPSSSSSSSSAQYPLHSEWIENDIIEPCNHEDGKPPHRCAISTVYNSPTNATMVTTTYCMDVKHIGDGLDVHKHKVMVTALVNDKQNEDDKK